MAQTGGMELLFALVIQSAVLPTDPDAARAPRLSYANAADAPPEQGVRVNQSRRSRIDWDALDESLATDTRQERPQRATPRPPRARTTPGRETQWNGAPVRIIDGRRHGIW